MACKGYAFEKDPSAIKAGEFARRKNSVREAAECTFYGEVAVDFFTCDKHLLRGVTLRIAFRISIDDFVIVSDDAAKHYKLKIFEANFYVRKMTLNDEVVSAVEKTLLISPAAYHYFETLTKTFLSSTGLHSRKQEDIFAREPIRRLAICLNTNETFLGNNTQNPFHFQKYENINIFIAKSYQWLIAQYLKLIKIAFLQYNIRFSLYYLQWTRNKSVRLSQPFYNGI